MKSLTQMVKSNVVNRHKQYDAVWYDVAEGFVVLVEDETVQMIEVVCENDDIELWATTPTTTYEIFSVDDKDFRVFKEV